ncbi:FG-GAP repeat protein [Streptomyces sp. NPDC059262]|uniref:FG-GAP repeat protein n=1 Tax=Streptomyces sp. NPDC059262 TaxID=3346797 RepID=UPI0036A524A7
MRHTGDPPGCPRVTSPCCRSISSARRPWRAEPFRAGRPRRPRGPRGVSGRKSAAAADPDHGPAVAAGALTRARSPWPTSPNKSSDLFGDAIHLADHNKDGRADLSVGAGGENSDDGAVWGLRGSTGGVTATGAVSFGASSVGIGKSGTTPCSGTPWRAREYGGRQPGALGGASFGDRGTTQGAAPESSRAAPRPSRTQTTMKDQRVSLIPVLMWRSTVPAVSLVSVCR